MISIIRKIQTVVAENVKFKPVTPQRRDLFDNDLEPPQGSIPIEAYSNPVMARAYGVQYPFSD